MDVRKQKTRPAGKVKRPNRLIYMDQANYLSTAQVAAALGVGVSTVKRWVDEDVLSAHRTPGGHRKLLVADVLRLVREGNFPNLDLKRLVGTKREKTVAPEEIAQELYLALKAGMEPEARALIQKAYQSGMGLVALGDQVIRPAMHRLGHAWETGNIDVLHEHHGTQIVATALYELKARLEEQARPLRPMALGGAPEGDPYFLTSLLIEMLLLEQGWEVINLGPNTPLPSLQKAIALYRPRLLWLTISYLPDPETFLTSYARLHADAQKAGVAVAVGGQALTPEVRSRLLFTTYGDNFAHLAEFSRSLNPPPQRPARGRPVKGREI